MAITSIGYDGSVNEAQWAKLVPLAGSAHYGVAGTSDWKVTAHPTLTRGVTIATGTGWGHGVLDTSDATVSLQGTGITSGSRWDVVVARRNWSGAGGVTSFVIIAGSSSKSIPSRNTTPGTLDDQPIALVQFTAGQTAPTEIVDLRCWSRNGGMTARDDLALGYLKEPGASIIINEVIWNCTLDTNGNAVWSNAQMLGRIPMFGVGGIPAGAYNAVPPAGTQFLVQAGSNVLKTDGNAFGKIVFPTPFPNGLISIQLTNGDDFSFNDMGIGVAGGNWGTSPQNRYQVAFNIWGAIAGNRTKSWPNRTIRINWIAIGW